MSGAI
ncbi:hypothetical protein ECEC1868_5887, partial [Escherichia coli EC1868]